MKRLNQAMKHMPSLRLAPFIVLLASLAWLACSDGDNASPHDTGPIITGTLYQDKPGYDDNCKTADAHGVRGEFRLMMVN